MPAENVLAPESVRVPEPVFVRLNAPEIIPLSLQIPDEIVIVQLAPSVTAPVPKVRLLVPRKVKFPPQVWVLLLLSVIVPPLVLSTVPPLMVS